MAEQIDLGGGLASMCEISPADQVGIINNLMDRIQALERAVSQLLAVNVSANQLSDLSQQVGWVYNVTYMGQPGWIQTEAGTLIPPKGFSLSDLGLVMSDGNSYPVVSVDSDGVLQFGFDSDGLAAGSSVNTWNAGSATRVAVAYIPEPTPASSPNYGQTEQITIVYDPDNLVSTVTSNTFKTDIAGFYLLSLNALISMDTADEEATVRVQWNISNNSPSFTDPNANYGPTLYHAGSNGGIFDSAHFCSNVLMYLDASTNQSIYISTNANATNSTYHVYGITLGFQLIREV